MSVQKSQDMALKAKQAEEFERSGKLGEAYAVAQEVVRDYLARKAFSDALNLFPLLFRLRPNDASLSVLWLDTVIAGKAGDKIVHLLVALCGPPGLLSKEVTTGGDPNKVSAKLLARAQELLAWFPREARVPYALAWIAYRQERLQEQCRFLAEAIRRDPDFCLAYLLFARFLADHELLDASWFVFHLAKEKAGADRSIEGPLLQHQLDAFEERLGRKFEPGTAEAETKKFVALFLKKKEEPPPLPPLPTVEEAPPTEDHTQVISPGEIELTFQALSDSAPSLPVVPEAPAIPSLPPIFEEPAEKIDLGEDLLEGSTKMFVSDDLKTEPTKNFLKEVALEIRGQGHGGLKLGADLLLKKAERFLAKRNYYLARKALRHAGALGADEATIKERLREVRKAEFPDSASASGVLTVEEAEEVLHRLALEVQADGDETTDEGLIHATDENVATDLERLFVESDWRTLMDLGVGLYEMGLYESAEKIFTKFIDENSEYAFNGYYLKAVVRAARKDFAGAASILKKLSADKARSEEEKLPVYYSLAEVLEKMGQLDRSRDFFAKAARIDAGFRNVKDKIKE